MTHNPAVYLERYIDQEWLGLWYRTVEPEKKIQLALDRRIVKLNGNTFERGNQVQRTADEMPTAIRAMVHRRDRECAYCGAQGYETTLFVDHIVPASAWPEQYLWLAHSASNLTSACESCNIDKSNKLGFGKIRIYPIAGTCNICIPYGIDNCDTLRVWCIRCGMNSFASECEMRGMGH
jgi:hypothetical protein